MMHKPVSLCAFEQTAIEEHAGLVLAYHIPYTRRKKKSMAFFSGDPAKTVLKGVPPDKSVGADVRY